MAKPKRLSEMSAMSRRGVHNPWDSLQRQDERPSLRNVNQHTPTGPGMTIKEVRPPIKLKWPWQKTKRGTYS